MVFTGGAVLAEVMKDKDSFWLSRKEYEEKGLAVLSKLGVRTSTWFTTNNNDDIFPIFKYVRLNVFIRYMHVDFFKYVVYELTIIYAFMCYSYKR